MTDGRDKGTCSDAMLAWVWVIACTAWAATAMRGNGGLMGASYEPEVGGRERVNTNVGLSYWKNSSCPV